MPERDPTRGCLVLSRKKNESIIIEHPLGNIEVFVVELRGDKVRIGISANKNVTVHRKEVYEAIKRENRQAAQLNNEDLNHLAKPPQDPRP